MEWRNNVHDWMNFYCGKKKKDAKNISGLGEN